MKIILVILMTEKIVTFKVDENYFEENLKNVPNRSELIRTLLNNHFSIKDYGYVITNDGRRLSIEEYNKILEKSQNKSNNLEELKGYILKFFKLFQKNASKLSIDSEEKEEIKKIFGRMKEL